MRCSSAASRACRRSATGASPGTSDSPSILNASPESAAGGGLAWLRTGDAIRIDLNAGTLRHAGDRGGDRAPQGRTARRRCPESATPWQELYRATVGQLDSGAVMEMAVKYRGVARKTPRHNH